MPKNIENGQGARRPVLSVRDLEVQVATSEGAMTVIHDLSFELFAGETLCLAGESGSGKSMTALAIMGLLPKPMARISGGSIMLDDLELTRRDHHADPIAAIEPRAALDRRELADHPVDRRAQAMALELLPGLARETGPRCWRFDRVSRKYWCRVERP